METLGISPIKTAIDAIDLAKGPDSSVITEVKVENLPERRFIPDAARVEIVRVFKIFIDAAKKADQKRSEFVAIVNVVREQLGIPENELWDINEDATYLEKRKAPVAAQSAGEGEDSSLDNAPTACQEGAD